MTKNDIKFKDRSEQRKRLCLKCRKPFMSAGRWNHVCGSCNVENTRICQSDNMAAFGRGRKRWNKDYI